MYNFTIPMALMDYIPVAFFGVAALLLQLDLYGKMRKDAFAMFAAGTINIFLAGFLEAAVCCRYLRFRGAEHHVPAGAVHRIPAGRRGYYPHDDHEEECHGRGGTAFVQRQCDLHHDDGAGTGQYLHGAEYHRGEDEEKERHGAVHFGLCGIHGYGWWLCPNDL